LRALSPVRQVRGRFPIPTQRCLLHCNAGPDIRMFLPCTALRFELCQSQLVGHDHPLRTQLRPFPPPSTMLTPLKPTILTNQVHELTHRDFWIKTSKRPGPVKECHGAATSRAEAQVLRLSAIYSVLGCSSTIALPHLQAALAVWNYCSAGAVLLFGTSAGDPTADRRAPTTRVVGRNRPTQPAQRGGAPLPSGVPYQKRNTWTRQR
jgi:hypothetical protein